MSKHQARFTYEQAILPEFLEIPTLCDMVPGDIYSVSDEHFVVDEHRRCWLDGNAEFSSEFEGWGNEITIIRLNEGYVVDLSQEETKEARFSPTSADDIRDEIGDNLLPVIGFIISNKDLLDFDVQFHEQIGRHYVGKKIRKQVKKQLNQSQMLAKISIEEKTN